MKRVVLAAALLVSLGAGACKKTAAAATPTVTITPASANVEAGTQLQFGVSVTNSTSTTVTWLVNGVSTLSAQQTNGFGTIDSNGLYTAPDSVPSESGVTITAELTSNTTIFNTAEVIVTSIPVLNVSPATVTVAAGQPTTLTLCIYLNSANESTAVTWYVNGVAGGNSTYGSVAPVAVTGSPTCTPSTGSPTLQQAVYTAPQIPPSGGQVVVSAVLNADNTQTAAATITLTFSPFSMKGPFVFNLAGTYSFSQGGCTKSGYFSRAGQFTADGSGNLAVDEDLNVAGSAPQHLQVIGTYAIGADGRGTATINDPFVCGTTASNYYLAFVNESEVQLTEADTFATGHGEADAQDPSVAFTGNLPANHFAFEFSGSTVSGGVPKASSEVGQFLINATAIQNGQADIDIGGAVTSIQPGAFGGSFLTTDANGRGTATINGASFAYYMIAAGRVRFIEVDAGGTVTGDAYQQPANPLFSTASLSSECSFLASGRSATGFLGTGGVFFAPTNGSGTINTGTAVVDQNNAGTVQTNASAGGSYAVDANGRGTLTLTTSSGTITFVFYFIQAGEAVLLETDSLIVADGMLVAQQGAPATGFSTQNLVGPFTQQWTGAAATSINEADTTGQIVLTGSTATIAGNWDTNNAFTLA
ncbi:MAG: hypothetical protein ACLP1Y_16515, partial [Candidatus Acidiferrales bacterium]